ncbi:MAG: hypothetical protein WCG61_02875 [Chlorobium sp.]
MQRFNCLNAMMSMMLLMAVAVLAGCATGSGGITLKDDSFKVKNANVALLPPRLALGSNTGIVIGIEHKAKDVIYNELTIRTTSNWIAPDDAVSKIQDANVLTEYEAFLDGYVRTGIPSKDKLAKIGKAIGSDYIALATISHQVSGRIGMGGYRQAGMSLQVLSVNNGKLVLEVSGDADCGSGAYDVGADALINQAAKQAISYYPELKVVK